MSTVFIRFNARPAPERRRAPLLEQLLARADGRARVTDWRAFAYRLLAQDPLPGVGPVALWSADGAVAETAAYVASPVHHTAGISSLSFAAGAILPLERGEAQMLAEDFNRVFAGAGVRLTTAAAPGATLLLALAAPLRVATHDPEDAVQGELWEFQPRGPDARRLRGLMSELEMWLFDHPVNRLRAARGAAGITGLWLWGGGPTLRSAPRIEGWVAGGVDPLFETLAPAAVPWAGSGVVVLAHAPSTAGWEFAEKTWLRPAAEHLDAGRLVRLQLSAGDWVFSLGRRWRWRIWRGSHPWWEQLRPAADGLAG